MASIPEPKLENDKTPKGVPAAKANEPFFFYEDEVFRFNRGNLQFGMVVENSEFLSSDESDWEDQKRLKQGFVRVAWHPKGHEDVVSEKKVPNWQAGVGESQPWFITGNSVT